VLGRVPRDAERARRLAARTAAIGPANPDKTDGRIIRVLIRGGHGAETGAAARTQACEHWCLTRAMEGSLTGTLKAL
jgi:hypothetical protein